MNGAFLLNVVMVLVGAVILLAVWYLGERYLSEHHWLRKWTLASLERRGPLETARMIGIVLLMFALAVLAIALS
jgi:glucose-6-phosphate-specific signal transduction histidine kinase